MYDSSTLTHGVIWDSAVCLELLEHILVSKSAAARQDSGTMRKSAEKVVPVPYETVPEKPQNFKHRGRADCARWSLFFCAQGQHITHNVP